LEGKGSTRLPVHEGGSYVNRGIFSDRWDPLIAAGLEGRRPSHPLLNPQATPKPTVAPRPVEPDKSVQRAKSSSLLFPKSSATGNPA
jgi:hypothetical protein